jgi:hypothetical protein
MATGSKFSEENWKTISYRKTPAPEKSFTDSSLYNRPPLQRSARIPYQETAFQREEREEREREASLRKKKEEECQLNDFNFPSLTSSFDVHSTHKPVSKSFASMAREWKDVAEDNRKLEEQKEFDREFKRQQRHLFTAPPPSSSFGFGTQFGTHRSSASDTYEEDTTSYSSAFAASAASANQENWTTVERKVRTSKPSILPHRKEEDAWDTPEDEEWNSHLYREE